MSFSQLETRHLAILYNCHVKIFMHIYAYMVTQQLVNKTLFKERVNWIYRPRRKIYIFNYFVLAAALYRHLNRLSTAIALAKLIDKGQHRALLTFSTFFYWTVILSRHVQASKNKMRALVLSLKPGRNIFCQYDVTGQHHVTIPFSFPFCSCDVLFHITKMLHYTGCTMTNVH